MTTAFIKHARMSARHLQITDLPLIITPHPLNDLGLEEVRALADAAYPLIISQLTGADLAGQDAMVSYVRPAERDPQRAGTKGEAA